MEEKNGRGRAKTPVQIASARKSLAENRAKRWLQPDARARHGDSIRAAAERRHIRIAQMEAELAALKHRVELVESGATNSGMVGGP